MKVRWVVTFAVMMILVSTGYALPADAQSTRSVQVWPTQDWATSTPEDQGMDSAAIANIYDHVRDFGVFIDPEKDFVMGCCTLHVCWEDLAEIRSLAVHPEHRNKKIGAALVEDRLPRRPRDAGGLGQAEAQPREEREQEQASTSLAQHGLP